MAVLKARPKIRVRVPNEVRPGTTLVATVLLDCRREVDVERVDVSFEGTESWLAASSKQAARQDELLRLGAKLCGARKLPKGTTELVVRIPLPPETPASYAGTQVRIDYVLRVHVAIDWWPDANESFEIKIVPAPVTSPETKPAIYASNPSGPKAREPHVELSLASTWTRAADVVRGAFALSNVDHNHYTNVTIGLRAVEELQLQHRSPIVRESVGYQIHLSAEGIGEGEMRGFEFRVPDEIAPSFGRTPRPTHREGFSALAYYLEITIDLRWGGDLRIRVPFLVLPRSNRVGDAPLRLAPPSVGDDRMRVLWEAIGEPHGLRYDSQSLTGRFGDTDVSIRRDHRGRDGIFLVATLRYPPLHLALSVVRERTIFRRDILVGDAGFDELHTVRARDAQQARAFLGPLASMVSSATLRRFDDTELVIDVRDAGQTRAVLERFVAATVDLVRRIERARAAIPPPEPLRGAHRAWLELATRLNGTLETARMRVDGQLGAIAAHARPELNEEGLPETTFLAIAPTSPLDEQHRFAWRAGDGTDAIARRFSGDLADLARVICADAAEMRIEPAQIALELPLVLGLAPELTVAIAERRLERMAQLANVLRGQIGPYR